MLGVPSALISNERVYLSLVSKLGFKLRVRIFVLETEETSILISFPVLKSQLRQKLIQDATKTLKVSKTMRQSIFLAYDCGLKVAEF